MLLFVSTSPATTRQRNARGDGELLRQQLLDAAAGLLEEHGDAARLSVRGIARVAGVSPTALYLHFPDRDALVAAAVDQGFIAFNTALGAAIDSADAPIAQLRAMGVAYLDFARSQPALYATLFTARRPLVSDDDCGVDVDRDQAFDALVGVVEAITSAPDARDRAMVLWSALHGYATLHGRSHVALWPSSERFVDTLLPVTAPGPTHPR